MGLLFHQCRSHRSPLGFSHVSFGEGVWPELLSRKIGLPRPSSTFEVLSCILFQLQQASHGVLQEQQETAMSAAPWRVPAAPLPCRHDPEPGRNGSSAQIVSGFLLLSVKVVASRPADLLN